MNMTLIKNIPFSPPSIGEEEIEEVIDTLRSNWITTGPKTRLFEQEFSEYFNAPKSLALNSCTAALHVALAASNIGPGDEVITTPMTFCSTVNVIEQVGATPVLVDIEPDTMNIDPVKIAAAVTAKTKVIMPVHYAGHPVDLDPIMEIAKAHDLVVIEDAAHALPAKYRGRYIGSGSNPAAFSFYATKNLTTGEGGMLTGDEDFINRSRLWSLHGMDRDSWARYDIGEKWAYSVTLPGFKYNITDIQSAIGIWQLRKIATFNQRRREIVKRYQAAFSDISALQLPVERPEVESAWHLYVLRLNSEQLIINRNKFIDEMTEKGIGTSVHFIPIHMHQYYHDKYQYTPDMFPITLDSFQRMLSIPLNTALTDDDVSRIIDAVISIVKSNQR